MSNVTVENHAEVALERRSLQFRDKPSIEALLRIIAKHTQEVESVFWELTTNRATDTAAGAQLDVLGSIVGQERGTLSDADYRDYIKVRVKTNDSSGTITELVDIASVLLPADAEIIATEVFPGAVIISAQADITDALAEIILGFLRLAKAGGVTVHFSWSQQAPESTFAFVGAPGAGFGSGYFSRATS